MTGKRLTSGEVVAGLSRGHKMLLSGVSGAAGSAHDRLVIAQDCICEQP